MSLLDVDDDVLVRIAAFLSGVELCVLELSCQRFCTPVRALASLSIPDAAARSACMSLPSRQALPDTVSWKQMWALALFDGAARCRSFRLPENTRSTISMRFNRDGSQVASSHGDHSVKVTDFRTGAIASTLVGHGRTPWTVAWHPFKPNIIASGCLGWDVKVWDAARGEAIAEARLSHPIISVCFDPTGELLSVVSGTTVHLWSWRVVGSKPLHAWSSMHMLRCLVFAALPPPLIGDEAGTADGSAGEGEATASNGGRDGGGWFSGVSRLLRNRHPGPLSPGLEGGGEAAAAGASKGSSSGHGAATDGVEHVDDGSQEYSAGGIGSGAHGCAGRVFGAIIGEQMPPEGEGGTRHHVRLRLHRFDPSAMNNGGDASHVIGNGTVQRAEPGSLGPHQTFSHDPGAVEVLARALLYNDGGVDVSDDGTTLVCCATRDPRAGGASRGDAVAAEDRNDGEIVVMSLRSPYVMKEASVGVQRPPKGGWPLKRCCAVLGSALLHGPNAAGVTSVRWPSRTSFALLCVISVAHAFAAAALCR